MSTATSNHPPPESLKVKQEEKASVSKCLRSNVYMTNLCKEENYHGGASVAVPFNWESQPGTPKIKFSEMPLPPLTPPPSYFYSTPKRTAKKPSKHNLLDTIFLNIRATRKTNLPKSPVSSSSSSNSSQSSTPWTGFPSVPSTPKTVSSIYQVPRPRKSFESRLNVEDQEQHNCESPPPVSTLCFGVGRGANARTRSSCYATISKVLLRSV